MEYGIGLSDVVSSTHTWSSIDSIKAKCQAHNIPNYEIGALYGLGRQLYVVMCMVILII